MEPETEGANTRQTRTSNKGKSRVLFRLSDDERDDLAVIARSSPSPHERREAEEALEEDDIARAEEEAAAKNTPGRLALARRRASSTPDAPNAPGHASPENNPSGTDAPQAPLALIATPDAGASSSNQGAQPELAPDVITQLSQAVQNALGITRAQRESQLPADARTPANVREYVRTSGLAWNSNRPPNRTVITRQTRNGQPPPPPPVTHARAHSSAHARAPRGPRASCAPLSKHIA